MKKQLLRVLAVILTVIILLTCVTSSAYAWWQTPLREISLEPMTCYSGGGWCGPSSGVSIGWYYKQQYSNLPSPKSEMYDALHEYMDTAILGTTYTSNYGPGFVEMALHYGYDNFSYDHYETVTADDWDDIKNAIENGWPVALASTGLLVGFSGVEAISTDEPQPPIDWPCTKWHWIAIKGVQYYGWCYDWWSYTWGHRIICTDNYSGASNLVLDWNDLIAEVGDFLEMVIIKDDDPENDGYVEDFEWGDDGDSLEDWQDKGGEVDWSVTIGSGGNSIVEIDDDVLGREGEITKSARFYRDGSKVAYAYYSLLEPSYISFWVKKDGTAYTKIANGNGDRYIWVRINDAEEIQYYGSDGYHTLSYTLPVNSWQYIEFKNINWGAGTYNIYVNGYRKAQGATMRSGPGYQENLYFGSWSGSGTFWIDDITDSLRPPL